MAPHTPLGLPLGMGKEKNALNSELTIQTESKENPFDFLPAASR
jgi:hypothetical protein